jgi:imidazolonepropionase-like amidohydrolase
MLPGLINTHVHLVLAGHGDYPRYFKWLDDHQQDDPLSRILDISCKQLLIAGVTSIIDLGAPLEEILAVRDRVNNGMPGPRIEVSGPWLRRDVAIFPARYQIKVTSPEQAAEEADRLAAAGVDVIKAHAGLTREDYLSIVAAAHKHGLKVHAHLNDEEAVQNAFDAGVDVLQHVGSAGTPPHSAKLVLKSWTPVVRLFPPRRIAAGFTPQPSTFPSGWTIRSSKKTLGCSRCGDDGFLQRLCRIDLFFHDGSAVVLRWQVLGSMDRQRCGDRHGCRLSDQDLQAARDVS